VGRLFCSRSFTSRLGIFVVFAVLILYVAIWKLMEWLMFDPKR
jgi:hypothetical protein